MKMPRITPYLFLVLLAAGLWWWTPSASETPSREASQAPARQEVEAVAEAEAPAPAQLEEPERSVAEPVGNGLNRVPTGRWAHEVPEVRAYLHLVPEPWREALTDFQSQYPQVDPTDREAFGAALMAERAKYGHELTPEGRLAYDAWIERQEKMQAHLVRARGEYLGLLISGKDGERYYTLVGFWGTEPVYSTTMNVSAAISTGANLVRENLSLDSGVGEFLNGDGLYVNVNDHGTIYEGVEFQHADGTNRIIVKEINDSGSRDHMTHVAGTVAARGVNPEALGMAPRVWIRSLIQQNNTHVRNYGLNNPADPAQSTRSVMGTTSLGATTTNKGRYTYWAATFDSALWDTPHYTHFYAAGNDGSNGYATLSADNPVAKNTITVGSVGNVTRTATGDFSGGGSLSGFSSRGPTLDGRIKPDIVANGSDVYSTVSTTGYGTKQGTSMATPNASGTAVLLINYYNQRFPGQFLRSSTVRALIVNTADDRGNPGPDYQYGWGVLNARKAAETIRRHAENPREQVLVEDTLASGQTYSAVYTYDGTGPVCVTLAWLDPAGDGNTATTAPVLVNDLNLRLIGPGGTTYFPYVMPYVIGKDGTPPFDESLLAAHAVTGNNFTDNVEQVRIASPPPGTYTVQVSHAGSLSSGAPQKFSLAVLGMGIPSQAVLLSSVGIKVPQGGSQTFTARLALAPASNVSVSVARTSGDTALSLLSSSTLTFTPSNWNVPQTVTIGSQGGGSLPDRTATFTLTSAGLLPRTVNVREEAITVSVLASDPEGSEPGLGLGNGAFTFSRNSSYGSMSVAYAIGGTATAGSDYQALSGTVNFADGVSSVVMPVVVLDDSLTEPHETVILSLLPGSGYRVGDAASATVTLKDDEPLRMTVEAMDAVAGEMGAPGGQGVFRISREGNPDAALTVNYTFSGTATRLLDYTHTGTYGTVGLAVGASSATVTMVPVNDLLVEGDETVILQLEAGSGYSVGTPSSATVTILDGANSETLLLAEFFEYGPTDITGSTVWSPLWNDNTGNVIYSAINRSFVHPSYNNAPNQGGSLGLTSYQVRGMQRTVDTSGHSGTFWISAIVRQTSTSANSAIFIALHDSTASYNNANPVRDGFGIGYNGSAFLPVFRNQAASGALTFGAGSGFAVNVHYLLLAKVQIGVGSDALALWLMKEDDVFGLVESSLGPPHLEVATADFGSTLRQVWVGEVSANGHLDALRISRAAGDAGLFEVLGAPTSATGVVAPGGLTATADSSTQITLQWLDLSANESGFAVERSLVGGEGFVRVATLAANTVTYADTPLEAGTTYYYRVKATHQDGDSAYTPEVPARTLTSLEAWRQENFGVLHAEVDLQDADGDGVNNMLEFAFGTDPHGNSVALLPVIGLWEGTGAESGNTYVSFTYRQRAGGSGVPGVDYTADGLRYVVEVSGDENLSVWHSGAAHVAPLGSVLDNGDGTETVTVRALVPVDADAPLRFLRLRVEVLP